MIVVGKAVVSDDIKEKFFVCDLDKCKGACCVEGDAGAPLDDGETALLEEIYPLIKDYLSPEGREAVEEKGTWVYDQDAEKCTPTIGENGACAYAIRDEKGTLKCGLEQAYLDGKTDFKKPISCHLYPIRVTRYDEFDALNYDRWDICDPACVLGKKLGVPVYKFLKEALIRKYGESWYGQLVQQIEGKEATMHEG